MSGLLALICNFWVSLLISVLIAGWFIRRQIQFNNFTKRNLKKYSDFFAMKGAADGYATIDVGEPNDKGVYKKHLLNVAREDAELHSLIQDINEYLDSCKGSATFEIMQNKTERRITKLYDLATSKASFPTHYGLMGTFVGVFLGLGMFLLISFLSEGVTDNAIQSLILGVLVSMSTSFIGLKMSTKANDEISDAKKRIDEDKNTFYEYIQNKLMPSVDVSLTEALSKLHETVSDFEPSFSKVIQGFKDTFEECTLAFGADFRLSVKNMVDAVTDMGVNIEMIKNNSKLLESLLNKLTNSQWIEYMNTFSDATERFKQVTQSLNDFERARRMMLAAAQEAINVQKTYNESLQIPRQIAMEVNGILQRVVTFERSINNLGVAISQTHMIGDTELDEIRQQITAIKAKHKVAEQYIETSNNKLEMFFDSQLIELKRLEKKYQDALEELFDSYENLTKEHQDSINERNEKFKAAIEEKFELSGVRSELSELKKLPNIERKIEDVKKGQEHLLKTNEGIRKEINALNEIKEEEQKPLFGGIFGNKPNSAAEREKKWQEQKEEERRKQVQRKQEQEEERRKQEQRNAEEIERLKQLGEQSKQEDDELKKILEAQKKKYEGKTAPEFASPPKEQIETPESNETSYEIEEKKENGFVSRIKRLFSRD